MRNDVKIKFRAFLQKNHILDEFKTAVKALGIPFSKYIEHAEAIYAFRRIFNHYGSQPYAKLAQKWDDEVVLNRYSRTIEAMTTKSGFQPVIHAIRELQNNNKWYVPVGLDKIHTCGRVKSIPSDTRSDIEEKVSVPIPATVLPPTTSKLLQTTQKPKLPDALPLPAVSHSIETLNFSAIASPETLDDNHFLITNTKSTHRIRFNPYISKLVTDKGYMYAEFRIDRMLNKLYIVFSPAPTEASILCRTHSNQRTSNVILNNIKAVNYLIGNRTLSANGTIKRRISRNLAHTDSVFTFEILDD